MKIENLETQWQLLSQQEQKEVGGGYSCNDPQPKSYKKSSHLHKEKVRCIVIDGVKTCSLPLTLRPTRPGSRRPLRPRPRP